MWMNKILEEVTRMVRNKDLEIKRDQNRIYESKVNYIYGWRMGKKNILQFRYKNVENKFVCSKCLRLN
jgi:hypothetical protein